MNFAIPTPHVFIFQANLSGPRYESFQSFPPLGVSVTSDSPFCSPKNQGIPPPPLKSSVRKKSGGLFRMKDTGPRYCGLGWGGEKQTIQKRCHEVRAGKARCMAIITTCVSCLEDDNKCMVYVSYIVALARPLQIASKQLRAGATKTY